MESSILGAISPCFIVKDVMASATFYRDQLGFEFRHLSPERAPYFAIVGRDATQIMLKAVAPEIQAVPNQPRHELAPWDAFVYVDEPDLLADELAGRETSFHQPLAQREDRLLGFEVQDVDGYVLFFGRPD